jgi:sialate O-acetylesterase
MNNLLTLFKSVTKLILPLVMFAVLPAHAKVILPACFTDNMVLQQKTQVNLWGKATAGKSLTITTSWNNKKYTVTADGTGNWKTKIATPVFGGPFTVTFNDGEIITLKNVLIGEVWVCSGQSNMEMILTGMYGDINNLKEEIANANYPGIRMLKVENRISLQELTDLKTRGDWRICSPETIKDFSAVAYFFAREFYKTKHIPVGLINTTWGGTIAEAWTSGDALKQMPAFAPAVAAMEGGLTQEQINAKFEKDMRVWMDALAAKDPGYQQGKLPWIEPGFDASAWKKMTLPGFWEKAGLANVDGTIDFRRTFTVPASWAGKDVTLNLGAVDDADVTWFNGAEVGHMEAFYYKRTYTIPGNLVKAGENTIAVRVYDGAGNGGFEAGPIDVTLKGSTEKVDLAGEWYYQIAAKLADLPTIPSRPDGPNRPTVLYNAMVNPIINYTIKGAIWYQGESNADRAYQYRTLFPLMISNWRQKWGQGNFPFYFVQLAAFMPQDKEPVQSAWAELREAQLKTLSLPNTGMAVTIDIGDAGNIHPANKQDVGKRLGLIALAKTYGEKVAYSGPAYTVNKVKANTIELSFNFADGLKAKGEKLTGFAIAGADKKFYWADAKIEGNKVVVSSPQVNSPVAVRYAWGNNPVCNLYNSADLPASPFRTDDWQGITFGKE